MSRGPRGNPWFLVIALLFLLWYVLAERGQAPGVADVIQFVQQMRGA